MAHDTIVVLDFGSQYNQLIVRKVREQSVYAELLPHDTPWDRITALQPKGIILSGSPSFVSKPDAPRCDERVFTSDIPILAICYGMQLMTDYFGGTVSRGEKREYGKAQLQLSPQGATHPLFAAFTPASTVLMSHGDHVLTPPPQFTTLASTANCPIAAIASSEASSTSSTPESTPPPAQKIGIQFHPEVTLTEQGSALLRSFVLDICGCHPDWTPGELIKDMTTAIRQQVGNEHVLCAVSGGVDSSVVAAIVHRAIGQQLQCIFVDTGLLRAGEGQQVTESFQNLGIPLQVVQAESTFLQQLAGVTDPEEKRKRIGHTFIELFDQKAATLTKPPAFLAQGTLYPDVIESKTAHSKAGDKIKTHHNVGGLPDNMQLKLLEPLRLLFKDEVRALGKELGLPPVMLERHPFPGPGLAVRILGEVTKERVKTAQAADAIFIEELHNAKLYNDIWQAFVVLTPLQSVGVMGDERTYHALAALRAVTSVDGMTAEWAKIPYDVLERTSARIVNEVTGINRVVYDISSKPPATIEWE